MISGASPDGLLAEVVELPDHPYFLACQFTQSSRAVHRSPSVVCCVRTGFPCESTIARVGCIEECLSDRTWGFTRAACLA